MRAGLFLLPFLAGAAFAQADLATYAGADREQRLLAGAKKEGELSMYTSAQADDMGALAKAFEKKYGVRVSMWRSGTESEDTEWLAGVLSQIGEEHGIRLFREIVQKNGISVRRGHTLLAQLVASGEVPLALTVYNYKAEQLKNKGAPVDWFAIGKAV